jgi:cell division septum initiation protein DivIVA
MTESPETFRVVLRGYDPAQVDRRIAELHDSAGSAQQQLDELTKRVHELEDLQASGEIEQAPAQPASFAHLGQRIGQILELAEEEAEEIRTRAANELASERAELTETAGKLRKEADRYAQERRSEADSEAARILEDARRTADDRIDSADRDAAARIQEAEAVYEDQRARAAKSAADFETTLAGRRKAAEVEFKQQTTDAQRRLEEIEHHLEKARAEADQTQDQANREARRVLEEAEKQAATMVNDAKTAAARVRADSERELVAATQRRDSINAQLANVRQMLVTLTGTAPAALEEHLDEAEADGEVDTSDEEAEDFVPANFERTD